ncbi:MAG: hypothetical protein AB7Y46_00140 [Armatimonadota bacterium]
MAVALLLGRGSGGDDDANAPALPGPPPESYHTRLVFSPTPERPDETPEIIPAESETIYCFYELGSVAPNAAIFARWWYEGKPLGELPLYDHLLEPDTRHAAGRFAIRPPEGPLPAGNQAPSGPAAGFPPGIYDVQVGSPAQPDVVAQGSFVALPRAAKILQGGGEPAGPPVVRSLRTATGVGSEGEAVGATALFAPTTRRIYAVFEYAGVPPGAVLSVRWYAGERELEAARAEIAVTAERGRAHAWLEVGERDELPPGEYQVSVHLGDEAEALASTSFRVRPTAERPPHNDAPSG